MSPRDPHEYSYTPGEKANDSEDSAFQKSSRFDSIRFVHSSRDSFHVRHHSLLSIHSLQPYGGEFTGVDSQHLHIRFATRSTLGI